jgi:membrane associated rhomboid family serine protease
MGLYDRDYTQEGYHPDHGGRPHMRMMMPQLTPVVKYLLIANVAVFLACQIPALGERLFGLFSVWPTDLATTLQIWRLLTYQFLHDGLGHIFFNMLILYFFGPMLERFWGSKKYLVFYLICGTVGGIFYPILAHVGWLGTGKLVGASGSILGMLAAAAILFPNMLVYIFGVIPLKMSVLAIIMAVISILSILRPDTYGNAGGEAAHLGGMVAGAIYVLSENWRRKMKLKMNSGGWERQLTEKQARQAEVDRILQKVHQQGIHSLTFKEKRILKQATRDQQNRR